MSNKIIAIIEDEAHHATLITFNLENYGFRTIHFSNVEDYINYPQPKAFSLILISVQLFEDGLKLCEKIKKCKADVPILLLSTSVIQEPCCVEGVDYLFKPFHVNDLLNQVQELLHKEPSGQ